MKTVELSDETHAGLVKLAASKNLTLDQLVGELVRDGLGPFNVDGLRTFLGGAEFRSGVEPADRYLALLAWCARNHASDFADFISHQESGQRYLMLSRQEVQDVRAHNHARQIDGTQYWAVMTIEEKSKRRFVRRLLEFIGCRDGTVAEACRALGLTAADSDPPQPPVGA